jgi:hypothetical protein
MSDLCAKIHEVFRSRPRHEFPYEEERLPMNGVYALFEEGEAGHGGARIVRFGGHSGEDQPRGAVGTLAESDLVLRKPTFNDSVEVFTTADSEVVTDGEGGTG